MVASGATQRLLGKKVVFPSLLQAKTLVFYVSKGEEGKYSICSRLLQVTFASSVTQLPELPRAACSHAPAAHSFEGEQNG